MDEKLGWMRDGVSDAGSDPILETRSVRRRVNREDRVQRQET